MTNFHKSKQLVAAFTLVTSGCALDDVDLGQQDQEVLSTVGTVTTARPEIGIYMNTDGHGHLTTFGCSGTLIAPDVVVTANHCLPGGNPNPFPPQVFIIGGLGGTQYTVDKMYRVGTDSPTLETTPTKNGVGIYHADVGLVHLATAVPASVATPATIGINLPSEGTAVTTFGYGCTNLATQAEDYLKRYASFTIGVAPHALCFGDSGGPVMYSTISDRGDLFAVNTATGDTTGYGEGDSFSDVSSHKLQIEDVIHAWHQTTLDSDVDRVGAAYKTLTATTAATCAAYCKNDGPCHSFAWMPNTCWLQSDTPDFFPSAGTSSGLAPTMEIGIDRPGSDYAVTATALSEQCAAACAIDLTHDCKAWSWNWGGGVCHLKSAVPASMPSSVAISGVANRLLEVGFDRPGGDTSVLSSGSPTACRRQCASSSTCRAFSWAINLCHLKGSVPNPVASAAVTSGVRRGLEVNISRPGTNLSSFDTSDPSPLVCQARCASSSTCRAWTFVPQPNSNSEGSASTNTCYLKSAVASAQTDTSGVISGIKGMEFLAAPSHF